MVAHVYIFDLGGFFGPQCVIKNKSCRNLIRPKQSLISVSLMVIFTPSRDLLVIHKRVFTPSRDFPSYTMEAVNQLLSNSYYARHCWVRSLIDSGGIKGGGAWGHLPPPPVRRENNGKNQPFSANFWIFAPSESHFPPRCPHKNISGAATVDWQPLLYKSKDPEVWTPFCGLPRITE